MNWKTLSLFVSSLLFAAFAAGAGECRIIVQKKKGGGKACVNLAPGSVSHITVQKGDDPYQKGSTVKVEDKKNGFKWAAEVVNWTADKLEVRLTKRNPFADLHAGAPDSGDLTITVTNPDGSAGPEVDPMPATYTNDPPFRRDDDEMEFSGRLK